MSGPVRSGNVVVVGSYNQDHVWATDSLPVPGATRLGTYDGGPGGKGFNQAVAAARAGARTTFIAGLGADLAAATARALATAEGIDLRDELVADVPSGAAGIFVDGDGRNVIVVAPGANARLAPEFVAAQADAFAAAAVVLAQLEIAPDAVLRALRSGRAAGALTVLNPAPANAPTSAALLAAADVLTPNETEFAALIGRHGSRSVAPDDLCRLGGGALHGLCRELAPQATLVLTLGAAGAYVSHPDGNHRGDAAAHYRVDGERVRPVDTTGAGDAFNGALAARLAAAPEAPFADAVRFANHYAALSTLRRGAALAMPRIEEAQ